MSLIAKFNLKAVRMDRAVSEPDTPTFFNEA